jgi:hypothetical protein
MTRTSVIACIACLSAAALLTGCEDASDCPAPTPEPAKTAAAIGSSTVAAAKPKPVAEAEKTAATEKTTKAAKPTTVKEPAEPVEQVDVDADLYVKRLVIARGVKAREPVDAATVFPKSEVKRIYAFVEVGNRDRTSSEVFVSFRPKGGKERGRIRLRVGASPRWRTWAYTALAKEVGEWEAVVRDAKGEIIGTQTFTVTEKPLSDDPYQELDAAARDDSA